MHKLDEDILIKDNIQTFRKVNTLNEWVDRSKIIDAIKNRHVIYIWYQGDETVNRGFRTIHPYLLGKTTKGNIAVRAWQEAGASDSNKKSNRDNDQLPGWRLFLLDGITSWMPVKNKQFKIGDKQKSTYNEKDSQMSDIYIAIDPNDPEAVTGKGADPENKDSDYSLFDVQAKKFKDFFDNEKNAELHRQKVISDLYYMVRKKYKKNPNDYIVVKVNNNYWVDKKFNKPKYNKEEIYGNLDSLFKEHGDSESLDRVDKIEPKKQTDKSFFNRERTKFLSDYNKELQKTLNN